MNDAVLCERLDDENSKYLTCEITFAWIQGGEPVSTH